MNAEQFARHAHRDHQKKGKGGQPYTVHLEEVAAFVTRHGGDQHQVAAAWLHDTVEDVGAGFDEIKEHFGPEVVALVAEVTDEKRDPKADRKARQIERAAMLSPRAALIKVADKTSNVRSVLNPETAPDWDEDRKATYIAWAKTVIGALSNAPESALAEFRKAVCE